MKFIQFHFAQSINDVIPEERKGDDKKVTMRGDFQVIDREKRGKTREGSKELW